MRDEILYQWLEDLDLEKPYSLKGPVSGGCISLTQEITYGKGESLFLKTMGKGEYPMLKAEAKGLQELKKGQGVRTPEVLGYGQLEDGRNVLALEWINKGNKKELDARGFGRELAQLHKKTRENYGWDGDNFIGRTPQINESSPSWMEFFRHQRLGFQMKWGLERGTVPLSLAKKLGAFLDKLEKYLPEPKEGPSLLHGDLWSGNYLVGQDGRAVVFDPAVYYGHREADLAMTEMFGGFSQDFYQGYREAWPLELGYGERKEIYNLYHYLNHLNLFGPSYLGSCEGILRRFR